ncbi:MAG: alkaline phosphatase family protein [Acidobacteriota bacterium]|nr:alkaline phosphatase family protein [Acidobacteriota bacterium]
MTTNGNHKQERAGLTRPRRLLLCLDGVPFDIVREARERGLFEGWNEPTRLLSPFPTMTNIALSAMLRATAPLGYESLYFDRNSREIRGGIGKYIGRRTPDKLPSSYMDELDYQEPLPFEFLVYVAPEAVWRADMRRFREQFRNAPQRRDYFAFLKGTDGLLHIRGAEPLRRALESLDRLLKEIRAWCGAETEITLFSDHGMTIGEIRRVHLQTHLRRCGYEIVDRLNGRAGGRGVALPAFGLIGYAALFCNEENKGKLAEDLTELEGVDFSIYRDAADAITVKGAEGSARIHRREEDGRISYRYEQVAGDPLRLTEALCGLSDEGLLDDEGYASAKSWSARTATHIYPDALANLYNALNTERVHHTADLLVNLKDGYYYGSSLFAHIVSLKATHGNALRASSTAFMMSTHRALPEFVRADEARPLLKD